MVTGPPRGPAIRARAVPRPPDQPAGAKLADRLSGQLAAELIRDVQFSRGLRATPDRQRWRSLLASREGWAVHTRHIFRMLIARSCSAEARFLKNTTSSLVLARPSAARCSTSIVWSHRCSANCAWASTSSASGVSAANSCTQTTYHRRGEAAAHSPAHAPGPSRSRGRLSRGTS